MLNPFFQQGSRGEQSLVQDLINEQLRMYGVEVHFMPRKYITENSIIREVIESKFDDAYPIEAYVENFDGYGDSPTLLSKFGIQITKTRLKGGIGYQINYGERGRYIQVLKKDMNNLMKAMKTAMDAK